MRLQKEAAPTGADKNPFLSFHYNKSRVMKNGCRTYINTYNYQNFEAAIINQAQLNKALFRATFVLLSD